MRKKEQRIVGLWLLLGGIILFFVVYSTYLFNPMATDIGKVGNISIAIIFLITGVFYLVKKTPNG